MRFLPAIFFTSRPAVRPAFFGGHRCNILSFSSPVFGSTFWTCSHRSWRPGICLRVSIFELWFLSNRYTKQPSIHFAWIGLAFALVNKCSPFITTLRLPGISLFCQPWSESKLFAFSQGLSNSAVVLLGFHLCFAMKSSIQMPVQVSLFMLGSCLFCTYLAYQLKISVVVLEVFIFCNLLVDRWESNYCAISIADRSFFILIELRQDMIIFSILLENWELSYGIGIFYFNPFTRLSFRIYCLYWKKEKTQRAS